MSNISNVETVEKQKAIRAEIKLKRIAHREQHMALHRAFDELFADFIAHHPDDSGFLKKPILELMEWSAHEAQKPTEFENAQK